MPVTVDTTPWNEAEADWLIVGIFESGEPGAAVEALDAAVGGKLTRLREAGDLSGELGKTLAVHDAQGIAAGRLLLVGLGEPEKLTLARFHKALMTAARQVSEKPETSIAVGIPQAHGGVPQAHGLRPVGNEGGTLSTAQLAQTIATAAVVGSVGQDLYRSEPGRHPFSAVTILTDSANENEVRQAAGRGEILGEAINLTRELVNRPAGDIYPESFAARAEEVAAEIGLACDVLDDARLRDERMGSLLAVAQGSDRPARVVVLEYRGNRAGLCESGPERSESGPERSESGSKPTLALVGKGVTFDSGGLSLKPNDSMKTMKCDMAGAATVLGAIAAVARLKLPVNVIGVMGLVENMVSGRSYKLGDVLTARNGTTIEVLNTDAEGRLVLADVLAYAVDRGADRLIDLATLTGACMVALGEEVTGCFSNEESWQQQVLAASRRAGEDLWPLPMFDHYADLLKSDVADCKNVGPRWGGAITAAKFLEKFVGEKPWVHLDIAGPSFADDNKPHREGGGTAAMLRTLVEVAGGLG